LPITAHSLIFFPLFPPAAERCALTCVCTGMEGLTTNTEELLPIIATGAAKNYIAE